MTFLQIIFYLFATVAVTSGMMVVASSNPVKGALYLVLTFFATAGIWIILHAEFLALILVLVYVGAVMTLFLFVVMMLRVNVVSLLEGFVRYWPVGVLMVLAIIAYAILVVGPTQFGITSMPYPAVKAANYSDLNALGMTLYTDYAFPFEIAAVILLTAIVAAISLTHRKPRGRKTQNPQAQINVTRAERVRLIKVPSEKKISVKVNKNLS